MRKNNVWKQALALVLSATLVLGNVSPVSAATGDAGTEEGAGNQEVVTSADALLLTADGEIVSDDEGYEEAGILFQRVGVDIVDAPIITPGEGNEPGDDGGHGKVFRFSNEGDDYTKTGDDYLTSVEGSLRKYDFSKGVTLSFDIYPEEQCIDWNYLFVIGMLGEVKNTVTGTIGFISAFDSQKQKEDQIAAGVDEPGSWTAYFPGGNWIEANKGDLEWDYFKAGSANIDQHIHKWYSMEYIYTQEGLTIAVNGLPVLSYRETNGYISDVLSQMNKGQLRLGKGVLTNLEGYVGLMDNFKVQPVAQHQHTYVSGDDGRRVDPTCTEPGYVRKGQCTVCGVIVEEIIDPLGHEYGELKAATDATCTRPGYGAHFVCERPGCGQWAVADETAEGGKREVQSNEIKTDKLEHIPEITITKATTEKDGAIVETCKREGCTSDPKTTVIPKASDITLAGTSFTYTGKEIKPAVTVKDSEGATISAENYDVSYSNHVNVGTATVTIKFKGDNYEGTATRTFRINAAAVSANLALGKTSVTLYTGSAKKSETIKVTAIAGASQTVTWKSDNEKIAKVDSKGKITAVKAGTTNVRATANGITKVVKVTVKNPTITLKSGKKKFTKKTVNVKRKKKTTLTVSVNPSKSGFKLGKMTSKQKKIAKVTLSKKGKLVIQGKKKGSFKIKITSGKATKTLTIKVK